MYLMGFVTSETQRPTGNVELVDLSLKYHPPELIRNGRGHSQTCRPGTTRNGTVTKTVENTSSSAGTLNLTKPVKSVSSRPRRTSLEDLPADLYMEPLSPLLLRSPVQRRTASSWVPEETPVNWLKEDLARSGQVTEQSEWWSFCIGDNKQSRSSGTTTRKKQIFTSAGFESVFADGGISIRVQHHPLATSDEESDTEYSDAASSLARETIAASSDCNAAAAAVASAEDESYARMLQHLQSIENGEPARKVPSDDARADSKAGVPIARSQDAKVPPSGTSPSLSSPVMEKMDAVADSLPSYSSWKKKKKKPKVAINHGNYEAAVPMREERELWYNSCVDVQAELSFHLWDEKCANSNDLRNGLKDDEIVKMAHKLSPPNVDALLNLRTFDLHSRRDKVEGHLGKDESSEQDYPSPSSFTCGLSPTSLFSDDQEPFCLSVSSSDDNMLPMFHQQFREETRNGFRKSPRSVLSQEPDEISHCTSDGSETMTGKKHQWKPQQTSCSYLYNDESSDLESPMQQGFKHQQPFLAFTYSVGKSMGPSSSSSSSNEDEDAVAGSLQELGFFQEANHLEPWLVNDGGVLDDSDDLEFLLSPDSKCKKIVMVQVTSPGLCSPQLRNGFSTSIQSHAREEMPKMADERSKHESPKSKHESSPMAKHESPKTKHGSPKTKRESPKTKQESPKVTRESPKTKQESPKATHESPKATHESPKTKQESPKATHESPKTKQESPKATHESPKTKQESPNATHESPKIKHESLKRSTSENKWVPYVTNSLYGYDRRQAIRKRNGGGSQPQNATFGKPAHGGKASVTDVSSSDKAPKRSVNFAADLVKEIPYSTTIAAPPLDHRKQQRGSTNANSSATAKQQQQQQQSEQTAVNTKSRPWETVEEEGPSILTSRRNRWRKNQDQDQDHGDDSHSNYSRSNSRSSWSFASRERVAQAVPSCAGKLFSWPRKLAFKVHNNSSRRWRVESESEESLGFGGDRSFGQSSRRDAELVRRILKGSQKKYSNLTEADIMKQDFG